MSEDQTEGATVDGVDAGPADAMESRTEEQAEAEEEKQPETCFTGANGNLGQRLIRKLLSEGAMITAVVRSGRAERELTECLADAPVTYRSDRLRGDDVALPSRLRGAVCCASRGNSQVQ